MKMEIQPLSSKHDLSSFDCGTTKLNNWLKSAALSAHIKGSAVVYVLTEENSDKVLAYVATSAAIVDATTVRAKGFDPVKQLTKAPAARIGKLAVDKNFQGKKIGETILIFACKKIVDASSSLGIQIIIVDAVNNENVLNFYRVFGFTELSTESDDGRTIAMALPIKTWLEIKKNNP